MAPGPPRGCGGASERLVQDDVFTSVHIAEASIQARDTKLGPEEITRDTPNVGEEALRNLGPEGVIRLGSEVGPGDILVGKITPTLVIKVAQVIMELCKNLHHCQVILFRAEQWEYILDILMESKIRSQKI